nr:hypothetical protein [Tanacetum cinerariifolium]
MLKKDNYVSWSSRLLRYTKSKLNGKLLVNSIKNGSYVRRMIHKPSDPNNLHPVAESTHEQTVNELTKKEVKQMEVDDQAIQTILMGHPKYIYVVVDICNTTQEIWLRVEQMMKGLSIGAQEKKAMFFNKWERFNSTKGESIESYYHRFSKLMNDFSRNKHFPKKIASHFKFLNHIQPEWKRYVISVYQTKDLYEVDYIQLYDLLKFNQAEEIRLGTMQGRLQGIRIGIVNQNTNQNGNGNVVATWAKGNGNRKNGNQVRCYNCRGIGNLARNYTVRLRRKNVAYLQTQLLIAQKKDEVIQLQDKEFDLMAAAGDTDEIKEVNANCILMANLQQASTSSTQTNKAPVYDSDRSAKVHHYEHCYDNEIFNMFTQEEYYTELLDPITEPHMVQQNNSNVISVESSVEHNKGTLEHHPATVHMKTSRG